MALYMYKGYQYIPGVGTQAQWVKIKNLYMKTTPANYSGTSSTNFTDSSKNWRRQAAWWYKKPNGTWVRVHTKTGTGVVFTIAPAIHVYSSPYPYGPNNGITISSPRTLNTVLYGKDGYWAPYITSSVSRSFKATYFPDGASKFTIDNDDVWNLTTNSAKRFDADKTYLYYQMSVNANSDNTVAQSSPGVYLVRDVPTGTISGLTQTPNIGAQLSFSINVNNHWYDYPDLLFLDWYRSSTTSVTGGTLLDTIYIGGGDGGGTPVTSTQYYTVTQADAGYYIVAQIRGRNSWTDLYGFEDSYYIDSKATSSTVTVPLAITAGPITDAGVYDASGYDNRGDLPIGVGYFIYATATGVNSNTTYRTRYRFYNWQTGLYYNSAGTQISASAWSDTYTSNSSGVGGISSVSISGSTANIKDYYNIPYSPFSSLTYSGGQSRWNIEIEISAIKSGVTETAYYDANLSAGSVPNISASPSSISPGGSTTISGSITGYPTGYSAYPTQYKVNFGDGSDSGWQTVGSGVSNPSYSFNHTYSSAGTYSASILVYPYYQAASTAVTVASIPNTPTGLSGYGTGSGANQQIYLSWNASSGAYTYDLYYNGTGSNPPNGASADYADISTTYFTTPYASFSAGSTYYWFVRAKNQAGQASAWSSYATVTPTIPVLQPPSIYAISGTYTGDTFYTYFSGGSNTGAYQIWWQNDTDYPITGGPGDARGTSSPIALVINSTGTKYMRVRSVSDVNNSTNAGGTPPSTSVSAWSSYYTFTVSARPAPVITYGTCEYYTSSSGYECSGTQNRDTTTYYYRRKIYSDGVWDGSSYDTSGCSSSTSYGSYQYTVGRCGYTASTSCTCYYSDYGSYYYSPQCCGSETTVSYTGAGSYSPNPRNCCPTVYKTSKYNCLNYDVNNSASANYYVCYSIGACTATSNSAGSRTTCYVP